MAVSACLGAAPLAADVALRNRILAPGMAQAAAPSLDGRYIAVLAGPILPAQRAELEDAGARIEGYLPDHALLVLVPPAAALLSRAPDWLVALHPLLVEDRISPSLEQRAWPDDPELDGLLTVQLAPGESIAAAAPALTAAGAEVVARRERGTWPRLVVRVPPAALRERAQALARIPGVVWIEPAGRVRFLNDSSVWVGQSWDTVGFATPVFAHGLFGAGQVLGVADTGLDADHASFHDPARGLPGPILDPLQRKVLVYHDRRGDGNWDSNGHGTHTAGTLAGDLDGDGQWDANGAAQAPDGMAPGARLAVSDADDTCLPGNPIDLRELFEETYLDGARIHSNSWGSCSCNEYTVHSQDVDDFNWARRDMAIFFSAGNSGSAPSTAISPGNAKDCITVGATDRAAAADAMTGFSSRGPASDGRLKPTLSAPGRNIRSAAGDGNIASFNDGVVAFSGTSMACPTAAGLAGLLREYLVKGWYPGGSASPADSLPSPSAALVKAMLINSARNLLGEPAAPSMSQGFGRILLDDVLYFAGDARRLWLTDDARGVVAAGESRRYPIVVAGSAEPLKVSLVWTDPPASMLAGRALVNDLDLVVEGPGGSFRGNNFSGGVSQAGGSADRLNVEEGVFLPAPPPGPWTVRVEGANVPWGPQPFALVVTGAVGPAPALGYRAHALSDPEGDGDGEADPGELVRLVLTIGEGGGAAASGVRVTLVSLVPWASVLPAATMSFPDVPARGLAASPGDWRIAIDPAAPCGEPIALRIDIESSLGMASDFFSLPLGGGVVTPTLLLADSFDALAAGAPPDPARWTTGFVVAPGPAVGLRVEADPSVEPAGAAPPSLPHALYLGRASGTSDPSRSFLSNAVPLDLSGFDRATLSFRYWVRQIEGGSSSADGLRVEASGDGGASFPFLLYTSPDYASGMDSWSYPDRRWHEVSIPLGPAGLLAPGFVFRFVAVVNADEPQDAVYLDDVSVVGEDVVCRPGCIPPAFQATVEAPVCLGSASTLSAVLLARGFGPFDGTWSFGDAATGSAVPLDAPVSHLYAAAGSYAASLEAVSTTDGSCRRASPVTVEVDAPPLLRPEATSPVCASNPRATLRAPVGVAAVGPMTYTWSFGDPSADQAVADPARSVGHTYPAAVGSYTARIRAEAARVPGCRADFPVNVDVVARILPAGAIGNALRAVRAGTRPLLDWSGGALLPRAYNIHRTARKDRLVETLAILGAEPIVASPGNIESALDSPPPAPLWYYEVVGREGCTGRSALP